MLMLICLFRQIKRIINTTHIDFIYITLHYITLCTYDRVYIYIIYIYTCVYEGKDNWLAFPIQSRYF